MQVGASVMCERFAWRPVCVQVLVSCVVSCVVRGGVVELSWMRALVSYLKGAHFSSRTCGVHCWRNRRISKEHHWMPGMSTSVRWG